MCNRLTKLSVTMWYTFFGKFHDTSLWILHEMHDASLCDAPDDMIWYDMIWYDMIWYDMIWYDMIWYDMIWYDNDMIMIWYDMINYCSYISNGKMGKKFTCTTTARLQK